MNETESFRDRLLQIIMENPGLHFRELQRRTGSAVGKLDYHLYQLERMGQIYSVKDDRVVRFFSSSSDTVLERNLAIYLRNQVSREIIIRVAIAGESEINGITDRILRVLEDMGKSGILSYEVEGDHARIVLLNREYIVRYLKKYGKSFIDSIAYSIFRLLDEL